MFRAAARAAVRAGEEAAGVRKALEGAPTQAAGTLSPEELERYSRQLVLDGWGEAEQVALRESSVLVVGAGALGSPVASYLAGAGIGRLGVLDDDVVELSNLHRQHLHLTPEVGLPKVHGAVARLQLLNPEILVEPYQVRLDADSADGLVAGHDLVVDCSDGFDTRYALNAACCRAGVDLVEGGVVGYGGLVMSIRPYETACYRCAFPQAPPPGSQPTCAQAGVLGPVAGVVGSLQALEAMKLLAGLDGALLDAFLQVDLASAAVVRVATARRPECADCGDES